MLHTVIASASTVLTARPRLLARMPAAIARIVLRASTALGLDKTALTARLASTLGQLVRQQKADAKTARLASTLGQLVRQQQAHAKTVIVANIPRQRRIHVQIAQQTPSLQSVLPPVQRVH